MEVKQCQINQINLSKPSRPEADGDTSILFPMAAKLTSRVGSSLIAALGSSANKDKPESRRHVQ